MALESVVWNIIKHIKPKKLLSLGYPDMLVEDDQGPRSIDEKQIAAWHHWSGPVLDTASVFKLHGIEATFIDIHASRGVERIVDLNSPLPMDLCCEFDIVLDPGTIEHCFNVAQAFANLMAATKVGGRVIHTNPINMINHGFWSINPTTYMDIYEANGWSVEELSALRGPLDNREIINLRPYDRLQSPVELTSLVVAKKIEDREFTLPMQHKYRINPELKSNVG